MSNLNINAGLPTEKHESVKVAVLGAGAFGTAMATIAARQDHKVVIYSRDANQVDHINKNHINNRYLSEHELLPNITATMDISEATKDSALIIHCIPAQVTPSFLEKNKEYIPKNAILCSTTKGLYLKTKQLLSEPILEILGRDQPLAFLSGPSFAAELMKDAPSAVVVASERLYHAVKIQRYVDMLLFFNVSKFYNITHWVVCIEGYCHPLRFVFIAHRIS